MRKVTTALLMTAAMSLAGCSSSPETPVTKKVSDDIYCVVNVDSGMQYVYRESDARKYQDSDGNLPSCHHLHLAKHNPGADTVEHDVYRMNLKIKTLQNKVEAINEKQEGK